MLAILVGVALNQGGGSPLLLQKDAGRNTTGVLAHALGRQSLAQTQVSRRR